MVWINELKKHWRVKERKTYPWPCAPEPRRTIELFPEDILSKCPDGTVTKQSGLCITNIRVPDGDLIEINEPLKMVVG